MAQAMATLEELVGMIERGEPHLPEMQHRCVLRLRRVGESAWLCVLNR